MTDENQTELQSLAETETGLRKVLSDLTKKLSETGDKADPPDKTARAISSVMKTLDDISCRRERIIAQERATKYTNWEDLPPPSPEEDARFYAEFKRLYNSIIDERGAGEALSKDDSC